MVYFRALAAMKAAHGGSCRLREGLGHVGVTSQFILHFEDVTHDDVAIAGGKGANLGELLRAGIPVPPGFIITTTAYTSFIEQANLSAKLQSLLGDLDVNDRESLERAAAAAQALITEAMAPPCSGEVLRAYEALGEGLVAVRSSATAEDTAEASFAGQQSTYLNIEDGARVLDAVYACWASLYTPHAISYRARAGIDQIAVTMAVPVQRMVQSRRSGVAFSCDPITHSHDEIVIEAVRGLGEALVSGEVTPDMYCVDKTTMTVLERTVVEQRSELVYGGRSTFSSVRGSGGLDTNVWREIPVVQRTRAKLSDAEIARLATLVKRVEVHYGAPQDIEWAEADGEFYVLQSRPVTTLQHVH